MNGDPVVVHGRTNLGHGRPWLPNGDESVAHLGDISQAEYLAHLPLGDRGVLHDVDGAVLQRLQFLLGRVGRPTATGHGQHPVGRGARSEKVAN